MRIRRKRKFNKRIDEVYQSYSLSFNDKWGKYDRQKVIQVTCFKLAEML